MEISFNWEKSDLLRREGGSRWKWRRSSFADRKAEGQCEGALNTTQQRRGKVAKTKCPDFQARPSSTSWCCSLCWEAVDVWGLFILVVCFIPDGSSVGTPSVSKCLYVVTSRRRLHKLGVSKITQVDFLPREVVSYSKETQTPLATHQSEGKWCLSFTFHVISGEMAREPHPSSWSCILP